MADKAQATAPAKSDAASVKFTANFSLDKVTKNTVRYNEDEVEGQAPKIGQLYIQKHAVPGQPQNLTVTVEAK